MCSLLNTTGCKKSFEHSNPSILFGKCREGHPGIWNLLAVLPGNKQKPILTRGSQSFLIYQTPYTQPWDPACEALGSSHCPILLANLLVTSRLAQLPAKPCGSCTGSPCLDAHALSSVYCCFFHKCFTQNCKFLMPPSRIQFFFPHPPLLLVVLPFHGFYLFSCTDQEQYFHHS